MGNQPSMTIEAYGLLVSQTEEQSEYTIVINYVVQSWGAGGDAATSVVRFGVQLNDDSKSMISLQTVNTVPVGTTGIVFLTRVIIPAAYSSTWKIQGFVFNQGCHQVFRSIPGSVLPILGCGVSFLYQAGFQHHVERADQQARESFRCGRRGGVERADQGQGLFSRIYARSVSSPPCTVVESSQASLQFLGEDQRLCGLGDGQGYQFHHPPSRSQYHFVTSLDPVPHQCRALSSRGYLPRSGLGCLLGLRSRVQFQRAGASDSPVYDSPDTLDKLHADRGDLGSDRIFL